MLEFKMETTTLNGTKASTKFWREKLIQFPAQNRKQFLKKKVNLFPIWTAFDVTRSSLPTTLNLWGDTRESKYKLRVWCHSWSCQSTEILAVASILIFSHLKFYQRPKTQPVVNCTCSTIPFFCIEISLLILIQFNKMLYNSSSMSHQSWVVNYNKCSRWHTPLYLPFTAPNIPPTSPTLPLKKCTIGKILHKDYTILNIQP